MMIHSKMQDNAKDEVGFLDEVLLEVAKVKALKIPPRFLVVVADLANLLAGITLMCAFMALSLTFSA